MVGASHLVGGWGNVMLGTTSILDHARVRAGWRVVGLMNLLLLDRS